MPIKQTSLKDIGLLQEALQSEELTSNKRRVLKFILTLVRLQRQFDIEVEEAPQKIDAGEFDIEIEGWERKSAETRRD